MFFQSLFIWVALFLLNGLPKPQQPHLLLIGKLTLSILEPCVTFFLMPVTQYMPRCKYTKGHEPQTKAVTLWSVPLGHKSAAEGCLFVLCVLMKSYMG